MLTLEMLPVGHGDCLILKYFHDGRWHHILIDGGPPGSYPVLRKRLLRESQRHFDLIVVTHIDADHIGGVLELLRDKELGVTYDDLWFNAFSHMKPLLMDALGCTDESVSSRSRDPAADQLGPAQGDALAALLRQSDRWNKTFQGGMIAVPEDGVLPRVMLPGGLALTVLSPTMGTLRKMARVWEREFREMQEELSRSSPPEMGPVDRLGGDLDVNALAAEPEARDAAVANGSSIALLAELGASSCLLAADAWPDVLTMSLRRLLVERKLGRLPVSALKLSHHGSKRNITGDLLTLLECQDFLISTGGTRTRHPDPQAIARIVATRHGARLHFNMVSPSTAKWRSASLQAHYGFSAIYPEDEGQPLVISLR